MEKGSSLTLDKVRTMLCERFESIDYDQAKEDVTPFISDKSRLDLWSKEFFVEITKGLRA